MFQLRLTTGKAHWSGKPTFKQAVKLVKLHLFFDDRLREEALCAESSMCSVAVA